MLRSVVLLRHASAGDRSAWEGDDRTRPLDNVGLQQSLALVDVLRHWPLDEVHTSPAVRCGQTVAAVAADRRLPVHDAPWLAAGAERAAITEGLASLAPSVLLCTHRESLGEIVPALTAGSPLAPADPALDKGAAWGLRFEAGALIEVCLLAAPALELDRDRSLSIVRPG